MARVRSTSCSPYRALLSAHFPLSKHKTIRMHAGMKTPEQFTPTDADFCIITFRLLPSPFLNRASREQRNTAVWNVTGEAADNGQVGQKGATTFVAPRLDRSRSWYNSIGQTLLDVTDNIYIGAHPGHNQQAEDSPHTRHTSHSRRHTSSFFWMPDAQHSHSLV